VNSAIAFDHISKCFRVEHQRPRSFQERFVRSLRHGHRPAEEIWVLRDVSFSVARGTSLGLIGPNGAGKSTLLKLCARVIEPSSGTIQVPGRVTALLELGVGFHPDLTGRENVFLYGSLVGIDRASIKQRFDEIVAFSEIERFIDLPVKHYSSGMYLRLAFAVAVHVDADTLLIDEAFAVGDDHFQRKCLERIHEIQKSGVTTVFVSHNTDLVRRFCTEAMWLQDGKLMALGSADQVITAYSERAVTPGAAFGSHDTRRWGSREVEITGVQFLDAQGRDAQRVRLGEPFIARIHYVAHQRVPRPTFGVAIHRDDGTHMNGPNTLLDRYDIEYVEGPGSIDYCVEALNLLPGGYQFSAVVYDQEALHAYDHHHRVYPFWVDPNPAIRHRYGTLYLPAHWQHRTGEGSRAEP